MYVCGKIANNFVDLASSLVNSMTDIYMASASDTAKNIASMAKGAIGMDRKSRQARAKDQKKALDKPEKDKAQQKARRAKIK